MTEIQTDHQLPGAPIPYVVRAGRGLRHLAAGQVVHTLAGIRETAGGFGVMVCDAPLDRGPIPMHWHEKEHDTWLCTRGKLQVWCGDRSRVLTPGDFAYVRPGDTHSYQGVSPRMGFFGIVAPGGWEEFFADAGEVWGMTALPPADRPFDFSRMGPAMAKHGIMRVENPHYAEATPIGEGDRTLPAGHDSYFLEAGHGARHTLFGCLSTALMTAVQSDGAADMRTIEGGRDAAIPTLRHESTTVFLYVLHGEIALTLDGEDHRLVGGDGANIPGGTAYAIRITSGTARWVQASGGGDGGTLWDRAGTPTETHIFPMVAGSGDEASVRQLTGVDAALA